ncbi:MAG TPA: CHAT domain-containing protein [Kofleriaceae bacterium]|jgi:hypothetical protein
MTECPQEERTMALADGELGEEAARDARAHLATCAQCQATMAELLQLDAAVAEVVRAKPVTTEKPFAPVIPLAWYRRRSTQVAGVALAAAASVAVVLAFPRHHDTGSTKTAQIALAPKRSLEARLAWDGASPYREYDVPLAAEAPHENVPLATLADVEKAGDAHGVGALALLNGDRRQAQSYLDRAPLSPEVLSDRAALALAEHQPERALGLCDDALAKSPKLGAAMWNRALALRDLGLVRAAAAQFREVAAQQEPGWADEATKRATALDASLDASRDAANRVNKGGAQLVADGTGIAASDATVELGVARIWLYDAIRAAPSAERLDKLRPLAAAIDADAGAHDATAAIDRAAAHLHPKLAEQYAAAVAAIVARDEAKVPSGPARAQFFAALRAAHADDLLVGAFVRLAPDHRWVAPAELPEFAKLTAASADPWMRLLGLEQQVHAALERGDDGAADVLLLRAQGMCDAGGPRLRCARIATLRAQVALRDERIPEAKQVIADAWRVAHAAGTFYLEIEMLSLQAELAATADDTTGGGLTLVRAYTDELGRRRAELAPDCPGALWGRETLAEMHFDALHLAAARDALGAPVTCDFSTPDMVAGVLFLRGQILRDLGTDADVAALRADIDKARATTDPSRRTILDFTEGYLILDRDHAAGTALLEKTIATAAAHPADTDMRKNAAYSYAALILDDAKRGDGAGALARLAQEQGVAAPKTCALGLAVLGRREASIAFGATGAPTVHYDETRTTPAIDAKALVPAAFAGCATIDVIARPPLQGTSRLFPDAIAWRYVVPRTRAAAPAPVSPRSLVVGDAQPPIALDLAPLPPWPTTGEVIRGAGATPSRVLAAIGTADDVVLNAHGLADLTTPDASFLALSPDASGSYALTAGAVRAAHFATSPLVILAACRASEAAPRFHEAWSLPAAFVLAGARAVIASAAPIPDADAAPFFDDVRARVRGGTPVAVALRDSRQAWIAAGKGEWVRDVMVFE